MLRQVTGRLINGDGKAHTCFTRLPGVREAALKVLTGAAAGRERSLKGSGGKESVKERLGEGEGQKGL